MVRRRQSSSLIRSFSGHSFTFDSEMTADYDLALQYSESSDKSKELANNRTASTSSVNKAGSIRGQEERGGPIHRSVSREVLRREITSPSQLSSSSTVRRVSRQLRNTGIGPLEIPLPPIPGSTVLNGSSPSHSVHSPELENATESTMCTVECREKVSLLELELRHYKDLYRQTAEEVDVTLDVANEQIAELQSALEVGSLEAKALALLELEKERNRKLVVELATYKERYGPIAA